MGWQQQLLPQRIASRRRSDQPRFRQIFVIARNSSFTYRSRADARDRPVDLRIRCSTPVRRPRSLRASQQSLSLAPGSMTAHRASAPRPARLLQPGQGKQHSPTASFFRSVHALKTRSRPSKVRSVTNSFDASEVLAAAAAADVFEAAILISRSLLPLAALMPPRSFQSHRRSCVFRQRASGSCPVVSVGRP